MRTIILSACVLGLASTNSMAAPVVIEAERAPAVQEFVAEQVSFADLDISGQRGLRTLNGRIRAAAARVCASSDPEPLLAHLESLGCYRRAMSDAHSQLEQILAARSAGTALAAAAIGVARQ